MTLPTRKSEWWAVWWADQADNFIPESIVPNIVEGFFDILEGRYYMFAPIEAFHDGLRETERMVIC